MADCLPYLQRALRPSDQELVQGSINSLTNDINSLALDPGGSQKTQDWMKACDTIASVLPRNQHVPLSALTLLPDALKGVLSGGEMTEEARLF